MSAPAPGAPSSAQVRRGLLLGLLGVVIFAMTFPMTRLAVGDASAPQMSPAFVTAARAALAGLLSIVYLRWVGALAPARRQLRLRRRPRKVYCQRWPVRSALLLAVGDRELCHERLGL